MKSGAFLSGLLLFASGAGAQWANNRGFDSGGIEGQKGFTVRGQVSSDSVLVGSMTVELGTNGHGISQSANLSADGSFEFHAVSQGVYELRVIGPGGVAHQENVIINGPNQLLSVTLSGQKNRDRSAGSTVSIRQLQHKVPSDAKKQYEKGLAAAKKRNHQAASDHFHNAVTIDPEFADAYSDYGVAQLALGNAEAAVEQFQKAVALVPDHTLAIANLSIALCRLKRFAEAGTSARQALALDPSLSKMRYILAISLETKQGHEAEALDNLNRAASEIPKARLLAADILTKTGRRDDAVRQLEQYLRATPARDTERRRVEEWLAELRRP